MKIIFIFLFVPFSISIFSQSKLDYAKAEVIFENKKKKYDSLQLNSVEVNEQLDKITANELFFNKLLYEDNYKNKAKLLDVVEEFRTFIPNLKYEKLVNNKELLIKARNHYIFVEKFKLHKIREAEIINYYEQLIKIEQDKIDKIDNKIIYLLTIEKIPIEQFNKMTQAEKNILISELEKKHSK